MGAREDIESYIKKWEGRGYKDGIPDESPVELELSGLAPSYRLICIAIMKNPNNLELLGFSRKKCEIYSRIKREEINNRLFIGKQLKLDL